MEKKKQQRYKGTTTYGAADYAYVSSPECPGFIVFDTETTGLDADADDRIVEFAAVKCRIFDGEIFYGDHLDLYIKPPFPMPKEAAKVNGITDDMLKDKPDEAEVFPVIDEFLGKRPILLAYNADFDKKMLSKMYERCGKEFSPFCVIDVMEMSYDAVHDTKNHKLKTVTEAGGLDEIVHEKYPDLDYHNALFDTFATAELVASCGRYFKEHPKNAGKERVNITDLWYTQKYSYTNRRIMVDTDLGMTWYSIQSSIWESDVLDFSRIDLNDLERKVCRKLRIDRKDLRHYSQKMFDSYKAENRQYYEMKKKQEEALCR